MSDPEPINISAAVGPFEAILLDTETTTNKETPERPLEVVELAWMPLAAPGGFRSLYKPTMPCTFGATAVHHILPEELLDKPVPVARLAELTCCRPSSSAAEIIMAASQAI